MMFENLYKYRTFAVKRNVDFQLNTQLLHSTIFFKESLNGQVCKQEGDYAGDPSQHFSVRKTLLWKK